MLTRLQAIRKLDFQRDEVRHQVNQIQHQGRVMIIENGANLLVSHRRLFEHDESRYFVGQSLGCEGPLMKLEGFSFVRDMAGGKIIKKNEKRIKVLSLSSPGHIVYQLPNNIRIEDLEFDSENGNANLMFGDRLVMNLAERSHLGKIYAAFRFTPSWQPSGTRYRVGADRASKRFQNSPVLFVVPPSGGIYARFRLKPGLRTGFETASRRLGAAASLANAGSL